MAKPQEDKSRLKHLLNQCRGCHYFSLLHQVNMLDRIAKGRKNDKDEDKYKRALQRIEQKIEDSKVQKERRIKKLNR